MLRFTRYAQLICFGIALLAVVGCSGEKGPKMVTVSGEVTLDDTPVPEGEIIFRPADGTGQPYAGKIEDGKYSVECTPGSKKVSITAMKSEGGKGGTLPSGEEAVNVKQYIPKNYNDKTTLTADVGESNQSGVNFPLKSK